MSTEGVSVWPLSAAATEVLLGVRGQWASRPERRRTTHLTTLSVKELFLRGAWRVTSVTTADGEVPELTVEPARVEVTNLPAPLPELDRRMREAIELRRRNPSEAGDPTLFSIMRSVSSRPAFPFVRGTHYIISIEMLLREEAFAELVERGLAEERMHRRLGVVKRPRRYRTASGDAWARKATDHVDAVERGVPGRVDDDPVTAARVAQAAAALVLTVPSALEELGHLRGARPQPDLGFDPVDETGAGDFDVLKGLEAGFEQVFETVGEGVDTAIEALGGAIEAVGGAVEAPGFDGGGGGFDGGGGGEGGGGGYY